MENMRTVAFQVPEELFQRIKEYLQRNNMTQRQFLIGLIEDELKREQTERESVREAQEDDAELDEEETAPDEDAEVDEFEEETEEEDESEEEAQGFSMGM